MKKYLILFFLLLFSLPWGARAANPQVTIYYNEACSDCALLVRQTLPKIFSDFGIRDLVYKDYINEKSNRQELNQRLKELGLPFELQSHIMTFVGDKIILAGHIPEPTIRYLLDPKNQNQFDKILVYQDLMHGQITSYKVWDFKNEIKEYPITAPITDYLKFVVAHPGGYRSANQSLFWLVLTSGLINGFHPCAFAVLLFFIAFLFTIRRTKSNIFWLGLVYILGIYLTYFLIGLGLLKAIVISSSPFIIGKIAAGLVIILGLVNLLGLWFPRFPIRLGLPGFSKEAIQKLMAAASLPTAFLLGVLVGLCAFPCSGGIYLAILGLLGSETTYFQGIGYLALYNFMFVLLLLLALALSANKYTVEKITRLEQSNSRTLRLVASLFMIVLGLLILIWIY